jgi:hypothetical protein
LLTWLRPRVREVDVRHIEPGARAAADQLSLFVVIYAGGFNTAGFAADWCEALRGRPDRYAKIDGATLDKFVRLTSSGSARCLGHVRIKEILAYDLHYRSEVAATGTSILIELASAAVDPLVEFVEAHGHLDDWPRHQTRIMLRFPVKRRFAFPESRGSDDPYSSGGTDLQLCAIRSILGRSDAERPTDLPGKMALVAIPGSERNLCERLPGRHKLFGRPVCPHLAHVFSGSHSKVPSERVREVRGADTRGSTQFVKSRRVDELRVQDVASARQPHWSTRLVRFPAIQPRGFGKHQDDEGIDNKRIHRLAGSQLTCEAPAVSMQVRSLDQAHIGEERRQRGEHSVRLVRLYGKHARTGTTDEIGVTLGTWFDPCTVGATVQLTSCDRRLERSFEHNREDGSLMGVPRHDRARGKGNVLDDRRIGLGRNGLNTAKRDWFMGH